MPEELVAEETYKHLVTQKKAQNAAKAAAKHKTIFNKIKTRPPVLLDHQGGLIRLNSTSLVFNNKEGSNIDIPTTIHKFNKEIVINESYFKEDGSIDTEYLEHDLTLGKVTAGLRMAQYMWQYIVPGDTQFKTLISKK